METEKPTPVYRLIGTHIPVASKIEATAILQGTTDAATVRFVSIGTKLGEDMVVLDIQPKQAVLKKAKQKITLTLGTLQFLKSSRTR